VKMKIRDFPLPQHPIERASQLSSPIHNLGIHHHAATVVGANRDQAPLQHFRNLIDGRLGLACPLANENRSFASERRIHSVMLKRRQNDLFSHFGIDETDSARVAGLCVDRHPPRASLSQLFVAEFEQTSKSIARQTNHPERNTHTRPPFVLGIKPKEAYPADSSTSHPFLAVF